MAKNDGTLLASPLVSLRSRLQTGIFWSLISAIFNQGSTFVVNIIIARLLGRETFGEYAIVQSTLLTVSVMSQLYAGPTATKYVAEFSSIDKEKTGEICGLLSVLAAAMSFIAAVALLICAPWLASHVFKAPHLTLTIRIGIGLLFFNSLNSYQMGALAGLQSYRSLAKAGTVSGLVYLVVCSISSWLWGLNGAVAGLTISAWFQWLILNRYLKTELANHNIAIRYNGILKTRAIILHFSLPNVIGGLLVAPSVWLSNAFLARTPDGYSQLALFNVALNFKTLIMLFPTNVTNVGMSLLNNYKGIGDERSYREAFWANVGICGASTLVGGGLIILFSPMLLAMYGKGFRAAYPVICILALSSLISSLVISANQGIQSRGKIWLSLIMIILPLCITLVWSARLLTPSYGAVGLGAAYVAGDLVNLLMTCALILHLGVSVNGRPPLHPSSLDITLEENRHV
jgi:O-antigen/teichoic acid export membrane protein